MLTQNKRRQSPEGRPRRRLTGGENDHDGHRARSAWSRYRYLVILCFSLIMAMLYFYFFLFQTARSSRLITKTESPVPAEPVKLVNTRPNFALPTSDQERYIGYYPHGGFHTQRLALENALTLCRILSRTLLLPPLWVGRHPRWHSGPAYRYGLNNSSKAPLDHCRGEGAGRRGRECEGYDKWTQVGWDWLVDVRMTEVGWVDRWDLSDEWLSSEVQEGGPALEESQVYRISEDKPLQTQITEIELLVEEDAEDADAAIANVDDGTELRPRKYTRRITIDALAELPHRVIHFDSLAGAKRLAVQSEGYLSAKHEIQASTVISNRLIQNTANQISKLLGPSFVAVDARLRGQFEVDAGRNMRAAWWELGRRLGVDDEVLEQAEKEVWTRSPGWRKIVTGHPDAEYPDAPDRLMDDLLESVRAERTARASLSPSAHIACPRLKHSKTALLPFNTPLFLTSSTAETRTHPALRLFYSTYPCLFTMSTPEIAEIVQKDIGSNTVHELDGYAMSPWLSEWVGWETAARAVEVVGTNGSAWGKWAEEVVQPIAKRWPIVFRD